MAHVDNLCGRQSFGVTSPGRAGMAVAGAGEYVMAVPEDMDLPPSRAEDERILRALREEIGARVRPFVAHLDRASVDRLLDRMARIRFKYDGAGALRRTPTETRRIDRY